MSLEDRSAKLDSNNEEGANCGANVGGNGKENQYLENIEYSLMPHSILDSKENTGAPGLTSQAALAQESPTIVSDGPKSKSRFFPRDDSNSPIIISEIQANENRAILSSWILQVTGKGLASKPVLKMTNIPWEISNSDVQTFLSKYNTSLDSIHIPIDRHTGKTKNEVYIELDSFHELIDAIATKHRQIIKSREIFLNRSSWDELFRAHFPKMRADLNEFITSEEISSIATICRYYKIHFSRKCAERPFEHVISIMKLLPWSMMDAPSKQKCFELLQMAVEALISHLSKPNSNIDEQLVNRLVQAGFKYCTLNHVQAKYLSVIQTQIPEIISAGYMLQNRYFHPTSTPLSMLATSPAGSSFNGEGETTEMDVSEPCDNAPIINVQSCSSLLTYPNLADFDKEKLIRLVQTLQQKLAIYESRESS